MILWLVCVGSNAVRAFQMSASAIGRAPTVIDSTSTRQSASASSTKPPARAAGANPVADAARAAIYSVLRSWSAASIAAVSLSRAPA